MKVQARVWQTRAPTGCVKGGAGMCGANACVANVGAGCVNGGAGAGCVNGDAGAGGCVNESASACVADVCAGCVKGGAGVWCQHVRGKRGHGLRERRRRRRLHEGRREGVGGERMCGLGE
jgi:hypothetical protein